MGAPYLAVGSRWEVAGHCAAAILEVEHLTVLRLTQPSVLCKHL